MGGKSGSKQHLSIEQAGTALAYFQYKGKPLLSAGTFSDFVFYMAQDAYDYKRWADWAAAHAMNHCRAYLPGSWTMVESYTKQNGGSLENVLFPYEQTEPGSRKFDLTRFDERYWARFRAQCEYLASRDIIIDLLMLNGWQFWVYNPTVREQNWGGHFFNPANNCNAFTEHLAGGPKDANRLQFYHGVADGRTELFEAQKAYYEKIIETTHDLGNIYYELIHELAMNYADWSKTHRWLEAIALAVRAKWESLEPDREMILGTDAGHLEGFPFSQEGGFPEQGSEVDWVFSRPYFNVMIWGNAHYTSNAREWRKKYRKPYIGQESFDDTTEKWSYRHKSMRVHTRKYFWKFMMVKCQQMDLYMKGRVGVEEDTADAYPHNYDPAGWNKIEDDRLKLAEFFDEIVDYAALDFRGNVHIGPAGHHLVLSSAVEALVYVSSPTSVEKRHYEPRGIKLRGLALPDGSYTARFFDPETGPAGSRAIKLSAGKTNFGLPAYTDDMAVHILA